MNRLRNFPNFSNRTHRRNSDVAQGDGEHDNAMDTEMTPQDPLEVEPAAAAAEGAEEEDDNNGIRRRSPTDDVDDGNGDGDGDADNDPDSFWNAEDDVANEERRREAILGEIERNQRANFVHFFLLCLVPTSLLLIVVASVLGEDTDCSGYPTTCASEPRSFINAFTTRCICDAVIAEP